MLSKKWLFVVAVISLLAAVSMWAFAWAQYDRVVATTPIVVPAEVIEPYTIITASMLEMKNLPRPLVDEPIYVARSEVMGKIATQKLLPGQLIYRHQAVRPAEFRLVDDPALEVVSFPVDPARAVGGQVKVGQRINIYRAARGKLPPEASAKELIHLTGAEVELLAESVQVVDVRTQKGEKAGEWDRSKGNARSVRPLQIITVAVSPEVAREIVRLAVEEKGNYQLWVTLSPLKVTGKAKVKGG